MSHGFKYIRTISGVQSLTMWCSPKCCCSSCHLNIILTRPARVVYLLRRWLRFQHAPLDRVPDIGNEFRSRDCRPTRRPPSRNIARRRCPLPSGMPPYPTTNLQITQTVPTKQTKKQTIAHRCPPHFRHEEGALHVSHRSGTCHTTAPRHNPTHSSTRSWSGV